MGEKFSANPVTGTGSLSVPLYTSPGRSGFGPQLSLSYDSGAGNGPFGFGWTLSLPSIARKTDKGLPQYLDGAKNQPDSDVFVLSGAEDLVPVLTKDAQGNWIIEDTASPDEHYRIRRYRPRIEGLFARIERWTSVADARDVHWRSISKDNILTIYGKDRNSRIADPDTADPNNPERIFTWLICETRDDRGNAVLYEYKPEDDTDVDLSLAHERNRGDRDHSHRTANRYLKRIRYGNRVPLLDEIGHRPRFLTGDQIRDADCMFEVVFDYGEHNAHAPKPDDAGQWGPRDDPFSSYRAGFEVRSYRLCRRVLMFHHFEGEEGVGNNCLVRSTDFTYSQEQDLADARYPVYTFLLAVTQTGYKRSDSGYLQRSLPPVEFEYTQPIVQDTVQDVDAESLENLPVGLDGAAYQWTDLHGEGIPGILTEQGGAWFYKRNLSPISEKPGNGAEHTEAKFAPVELVASRPNLSLVGGQAQFMDLAGDGQPDLVVMDGPTSGLYEHDDDEGWQPFHPFTSRLNRDTRDPNLRLVDLDGDGHADVLITEDGALVWHASLAEEGFGSARRVAQALDEENGPRLVFADGTQSIYLADFSGDGLTDLVRITNGEVCYWPNLGYGRFGAKVTMDHLDHSGHFDHPDQFDHKRIRLADIDGTGTTDIIYLHCDGVRLYFNQSGNSWSAPQVLRVFPRVDDLASITPTDLLGNGTACLVWSSPLPSNARQPMRYVNLMGGREPDQHVQEPEPAAQEPNSLVQKPHLLVSVKNNLGAETRIEYAPSTKFYLQDKRDGKPWITRLPFPVHVVERVETHDHISGNRFVTCYAYHHGYFDGEEREFRGFGMVEQRDTEEFAALTADGALPAASNIELASHVPSVLTRTWFHTGVYLGREHVSDYFAGLLGAHDRGEYYREPASRDADLKANEHLLPDTVMPSGLALEEEREACRALKGAMLRKEVYTLDGSGEEDYPFGHPYTVTEQNFTIRCVQARAANRHAVFFTHAREAISYHYERNPADPRIGHALTLKVDEFGNVLRSLSVAYPRANVPERQPKQNETHLTLTLDRFANRDDQGEWYRVGLPVETRTYEVVKPPTATQRFTLEELTDLVTALVPPDRHEPSIRNTIPYEQWDWREQWKPQTEPGGLVDGVYKHTRLRLIEHVRTLYRPDDMGAAQQDPLAVLSLGTVASLALPGETYKLAFTPELLAQVYERNGQELLSDQADVLGGQGADRGGYVDLDGNGNWWIPSGRAFLSPNSDDTAAMELDYASRHFFLPHRFRDPFGGATTIAYDSHDTDPGWNHNLLVVQTRDPLDNTIVAANDYRVLQPRQVTDPNGNRSEVAYDALGMVAGTAVMGKEHEPDNKPKEGDMLDNEFQPDPIQDKIGAFLAQPRVPGASPSESAASQIVHELLGKATTRVVYDLHRYKDTASSAHPQPVFAATIARETHIANLNQTDNERSKLQVSFSYSDGFGREIQKKIQAEPGVVPKRNAQGNIIVGADGPEMTASDLSLRWVGSGWTIFNNKGKPVRQYEPFFTDTHHFEFDVKIGVSPVLFYDPVERAVATLHPNHTYEKVVFDPWQQTTWDVNDTVKLDPSTDKDVKGFFVQADGTPRLPTADYLPTWHALRTDPEYAPEASQRWPDPKTRNAEKGTAEKAAVHEKTPATVHFDTLGRSFLTIAHNKCERKKPDGTIETVEEKYPTRVELDIEGNQREVRDAIVQNGDDQGRIVMRYDYDMLGNRIHQASMEAGERWMLNDVTSKPIRAWDSRRFLRRMTYDKLRRPTRLYVTENGAMRLAERTVYGESLGDSENHRTRVHKVFDGAGVVTNEAYDFKGNLLRSKRKLLPDYKQAVDWKQNPTRDNRTFTSSTSYDALNRPLTVTTPDNSVYHPTFNEANLLDKVDVDLRGAPASTPFVTNIDYDAKGQRKLIAYGNGAQTTYEYDRRTFRLIHLKTTRPAGLNGLAPIFAAPTVLQDLLYTYDPAGNIVRIEDTALSTVHHNGQHEPVCNYTYDAIYRLIEASGREHIGQTVHDFDPPESDRRDYPFVGHRAHPNDLQALRTYTERYEYDAVGNFQFMRHSANGGSWTRRYEYEEESLTEPGKTSNRLTRTTVGNGLSHIEKYTYRDSQDNDVQGCMTSINMMKMTWDFEDQLQQVELGGGGKAYYVYDASGQRVRKIIHRQNGNRQEERIYLGGYEIYLEYNGNGQTVTLERETLHVMDDQQRIAIVETQRGPTVDMPLIRYQLGNHLGSASLELDKSGGLISYEEYHPYGTTAFQAKSVAETSLKRYRYTGKERDEESGFYYHGGRHYAPWVARWVSCDPLGIGAGLNLFVYVNSSPIGNVDPDGRQPKKITVEGEMVIRDGRGKIIRATTTSTVIKKSGEGTLSIGRTREIERTRDFRKAELAEAQSRLDASKTSEQRTDVPKSPSSVVFSNPMGETNYEEGRGATSHGLDANRDTSDWASKAAQDMHAEVGTPVRAATEGKVLWVHRDERQSHYGKVFGDQVTIVSSNGAMKTFYTHIDADTNLKPGATVKRGQVIGWVTFWSDSPKDTHLHFGAASKRADGTYKGIDPVPLLHQTKGSGEAHDVTFSDDGNYTVERGPEGTSLPVTDPKKPTPERLPQLPPPDPSPSPTETTIQLN